ncbi:4-hydroxy-tetrahydrodipicolinate synthase [Convivina praedatoris]|uniref:4-hydroxy-tetrahydrodipicolinate synthase n=1 Tax=Convivina praedatoris TaxID=2880963 RepID=A0ABN8HBY6_9LACO|nr:4-hydroxy-tetrahydrodipicolinate synthase [Convivina sp. LMG 32447]CAH1852119.1 4-hydroxy-tetrahydrodipicolinate synthase [Convivina sp. LMG 32447]CAH1852146.1 4-hydroxy-tetrahydrodipicolinate synthase [Convivina sp. LMG 32447]CAH1852788.1 4-hydroxy-tetrahydrodipicolinate synthase [Convivina sp. LMG 32447]
MFEEADLMTAIITPFDQNDQIDYDTLAQLTERYLQEGHRGFIIGGTTGETPTLSHDEKLALYSRFAKIVAGRVPIVAGTGSNNTAETISLTQEVSEIEGINAALVVVPYYNKPDQRRMIAHFSTVADQGDMPVIMYNIPGRTGVTMANETILTLAQNPNIVGVKQCTNMPDLEYLVQNAPADFLIYSGEDEQALFAKIIGAKGIISVASHVYGPKMRQMYDVLYQGDYQQAGRLQSELTPKMAALFMYSSPAPVKAILTAQGYQVGAPRLPILPLDDEEKAILATKLGLAPDALQHTLKELN